MFTLALLAAAALALQLGTASGAGECHIQEGVAYEEPAEGDTWAHSMSVTSAGECCARCRAIQQCHVGNYATEAPRHEGGGNCDLVAPASPRVSGHRIRWHANHIGGGPGSAE